MIREIIIPNSNTYTLHLPDSMIGKEVEILAFDMTENSKVANTKDTITNLDSTISNYNIIEFCKKISTNTPIGKFNREELYD